MSFNGIDYGWRVFVRDQYWDGYTATALRFVELDLIRIEPRGKVVVRITLFTDVEEAVRPSDVRGILDMMRNSGYDPCDGILTNSIYRYSQSQIRNRDSFIVEEIMSS